MQTIHVNYSITVSDFRKATYYGLFLRHRRALQIMFLVLGVSILYAIGGALGLGTVNYLVFFLALAYLIWGIFLFAGAEKGIRQHIAQVCNLPALLQTRKKAKPTSRSASPFVAFTNFHLLPQIFFRQALMGNHSQSRQMSASISLVIFSSISRIKS